MREYKYTIEQFMPYMKPGWVACDKTGLWAWYSRKPHLSKTNRWDDDLYWDSDGNGNFLRCFDIIPAEDWTKSLKKVRGK